MKKTIGLLMFVCILSVIGTLSAYANYNGTRFIPGSYGTGSGGTFTVKDGIFDDSRNAYVWNSNGLIAKRNNGDTLFRSSNNSYSMTIETSGRVLSTYKTTIRDSYGESAKVLVKYFNRLNGTTYYFGENRTIYAISGGHLCVVVSSPGRSGG